MDKAEALALPASLNFYKELQKLGFKIFLLTGRDESQRAVTEKNLKNAGYSNWERLILRYICTVNILAFIETQFECLE